MNKLITQILFVAGIAIVTFLILSISVRPRQQYTVKFKPADVAEVQISTQKFTYQLRKVASDVGVVWVIIENGIERLANETDVVVMLAKMARITPVEKFVLSDLGSGTTPEMLGLGNTAAITVRMNSGKAIELFMGEMAPTGTEYYFSSSQAPDTVYTIPNIYFSNLVRPPLEYWQRQMILLPEKEGMVELQWADRTAQLRQTEAGWECSNSQSCIQDVAGVIQVLKALRFTSYFDVIEGESLNLSKYGLELPNLTIKIKQDKAEQVYLLSNYNGRYYMYTASVPAVFVLQAQSAGALLNYLQESVLKNRS